VVPARAGSKRLPGKNLKTIAGHSLIAWAVWAGKRAGLVDDVVISTDSPAMMVEGMKYGALPHRRPYLLATDTASTDAVLFDIMEGCQWAHDVVVLLQPTVPGRRLGLVDECIRRLWETGADCVFTARELHFVWRRQATHSGNGAGRDWRQANAQGRRCRHQDFVPCDEMWEEDGAVFACRASLLRREPHCRIGGRVEIVSNSRVVDIDTQTDLDEAAALLSGRESGAQARPALTISSENHPIM